MNYPNFLLTSWLILLLFIMPTCPKKNDTVVTINLLNHGFKETALSSIADDINYIPLSRDSIIGFIIKIIYRNGYFYIGANKYKLLKFNNEGKFETSIGKMGEGPGEFLDYADFDVGNGSGIIYILSSQQKKLFKYNSSGDFIEEISLSLNYPSRIRESNDTLLIYHLNNSGDNQYGFELLDLHGKIFKRFPNNYKFKVGNTKVGFAGECLLYDYQGKPVFKEISSDTIFCIERLEKKPKYIINPGEYKFSNRLRENFNGDLSKFKNAIMQSNITETDDFLFYTYFVENKVHYLVYNKKASSQYEINGATGFKNDFDGGLNVVFKTNIYDNTLLTWIDAYQLKAHVASDAFKNSTPKFPEKKKELEKLANSLNENDNPVLMLVKLKE